MSNLTAFIEKKIKVANIEYKRLIFITKFKQNIKSIIGAYEEPKLIYLVDKKPDKEYTYLEYKNINKLLGCTYNILIMDDFHKVTPNILCIAMETLKGGGSLIIIFNEDLNLYWGRFFKFLKKNENCIFLDKGIKNKIDLKEVVEYKKWKNGSVMNMESKNEIDSKEVVENKKWKNENLLFGLCANQDQYDILKCLIEDLNKNRFISVILSSRGRGKSATIGLLLAHALISNFKKIHILSPNVENIQTIFEFLKKGLESQNIMENEDFETINDKNKNIIKIIFKRKTVVEYLVNKSVKYNSLYNDSDNSFCDLLVIDEAAAISPIILKSKLKQNSNIIISTTTMGYEGTGQYFSKKFIETIKNQPHKIYYLYHPIRYSKMDKLENMLIESLLLKNQIPETRDTLQPIENYKLYYVNKRLLINSEPLFQIIANLLACSHYRNSPDDIYKLITDNNHQLFVLLTEDSDILNRIVCVLHVVFEIGSKNVGNLIKNCIFDHYFENLNEKIGIRIFRIAVHPEYENKGFGSMALKKLIEFVNKSNEKFENEIFENNQDNLNNTDENSSDKNLIKNHSKYSDKNTIKKQKLNENLNMKEKNSNNEIIKVINNNILFVSEDLIFPFVDFIGVSFSFNDKIYQFWRKNNFIPIYLQTVPNIKTGAYSTIMMLNDNRLSTHNLILKIYHIFQNRFLNNLKFYYKDLHTKSIRNFILYSENNKDNQGNKNIHLNSDEINRLKMFFKGSLNIYRIIDIIPKIAIFYFENNNRFLDEKSELFLIRVGLMNLDPEYLCFELKKPNELIQSLGYYSIKTIYEKYIKE